MKPGNFGSVFDAFHKAREAEPFVWGANDCASNPADLAVAAGLPDFLDGLRGYDTALSAATTLAGADYADLLELAEDRLTRVRDDNDMPSISFAETGDIAVYENDGLTGIYRYTFAIFRADGFIQGPGERCVVVRPRFHRRLPPVIAAFRLG